MSRSKVKSIDGLCLARVCPSCNLYRTLGEFRGFGRMEKLCKTCRTRAARNNRTDRVRRE